MLEANGLSSDQLQESFINTSSAWVNMLLSSCGPIKTPVAACATAAVSVGAGGGGDFELCQKRPGRCFGFASVCI
jgi:hypothetical protein